MTARQARIPEAYRNTFEWVFRDPKIKFKEWLESDCAKDVYWLSGKPGSGKSTLMNFLYNHQQARESLQVWAGPERQLVLCSYFFWALGGTEKQKSLEGLLRSLLHGVLQQCPKLIPVLCPSHIQHTFNSGNRDPWTLAELRESFAKLTQLDKITPTKEFAQSIRFCLFIDGLDEYTGQKADLITLCNLAIPPAYIKLCVASRSWPAFSGAFRGDGTQMLEMHELTKMDIENYARSEWNGHSQVVELRKQDSLAFVYLVDEIVRKAQGVFLWVYLVVQSLLDGLSNDDDLSKLEQRLGQLPDDLDGYYQHVMDGIETIYRKETAQILRMFLCAKAPIPLLSLPPALGTSTYRTVDEEVGRSKAWATQSNKSIRKQLHARCRDFLQIEPDPMAKDVPEYHHVNVDDVAHCRYVVDFLHLSARDYLNSPAVAQQLLDWDDELSEPHLLICECYIFFLKVLPESIFEGYWNISWRRSRNRRESFDEDEDKDKVSITSVEDIAFHLRQTELRMRESPWILVDECQKLVHARTQGTKTCPSETDLYDIRPQDDFLPWALSEGLVLYFEEKLRQRPNCITENNERMILFHATQSHSTCWGSSSTERNARLYIMHWVLNRGVSPNDTSFDETPRTVLWLEWLLKMLVSFRFETPDRYRLISGGDDFLARTAMLLEYGADPDSRLSGSSSRTGSGCAVHTDYDMAAIEVLREIFRPEQVAMLVECIHKAQKAGLRRSQASEEQRLDLPSNGTDSHQRSST